MPQLDFDPNQLVQRFRPLYRFHSEEMWYPCHPEDELRCHDLVRVADDKLLIPALGEAGGSPADQLLATPLGLRQLEARGIELDTATIDTLQWASADGKYGYLTPFGDFLLRRADDRFLPPYGWIDSVNFAPPAGTWFHRGAPNNPLTWLGGDPKAFAPPILDPPAGCSRGAWQEPVTGAWVQAHRIAGVDYVDLIYTVLLGWNGSISMLPGQDEHPNDVETVVVRLAASNPDRPLRYSFAQHAGFSWYDDGQVEKCGDRVVVYLARQSHECYPHAGRYCRLFGAADDLCDSDGVTWDAPVQYLARPQGVDSGGVDTDALRCSISPDDPNGVILVPLEQPGPLWQYVRFSFLAWRPPPEPSNPLGNDDFIHQPFPLATTKWWPGEGPAGRSPPLSGKAAEPSGPGILQAFFDNVAVYLGPNPLPACRSPAGTPAAPAEPALAQAGITFDDAGTLTATGLEIGASAAKLAPDASFVDWRGGIGRYILGLLDAQMPDLLSKLPDPWVLHGVAPLVPSLTVTGLSRLTMDLATGDSPARVRLRADLPQLAVAASVSLAPGPVAVTATLSTITLAGTAILVTPVATPGPNGGQWYVPYVGPLPYSYATAPFETTSGISSATLTEPSVSIASITVDIGNPLANALLDLIVTLFMAEIEDRLASLAAETANTVLAAIYAGTLRVA